MSDSQNWYFTAETNAKGYTYIKAYQTKWDPVRKRSHSFNRRHVGRLHDDGRVVPSKAFLEQFPQYAGFPLFYGADKRLVDERDLRRDFPERPGPDRDIEEALKTMCLTLVPLGLLRRLPKKLAFSFIGGYLRSRTGTRTASSRYLQIGPERQYGRLWRMVEGGLS